jgi:hypothetical protein
MFYFLLLVTFIAVPIGSQASDIFISVRVRPNLLPYASHLENGIVFFPHSAPFAAVFLFVPIQKITILLRQFIALWFRFSFAGGMRTIARTD